MAYRFVQFGCLSMFRWEDPITLQEAEQAVADVYGVVSAGHSLRVWVNIFPIRFQAPPIDIIQLFQEHAVSVHQHFRSIHLILEGEMRDVLPMQVFLSDACAVIDHKDLYLHLSLDEALIIVQGLGVVPPSPAPEVYAFAVEAGILRDEEGALATPKAPRIPVGAA